MFTDITDMTDAEIDRLLRGETGPSDEADAGEPTALELGDDALDALFQAAR
jgi:hypothetical protein